MKVLENSLKETIYELPPTRSKEAPREAAPLEVKKVTQYQENEVAYISDDIGLHHVANPDLDGVAVSLHCKYLPTQSAAVLH